MGSSVYIMYVRDGQLDMRFFYGPLTSISISMFLTYNNFVCAKSLQSFYLWQLMQGNAWVYGFLFRRAKKKEEEKNISAVD